MSQATVSQTNTNRNNNVSSSNTSINVNHLPLNHQEFLKRVETFNSLKSHINQHNINPLVCARFGWQCISPNTLQCTGCNTKITINYTNNQIDTNTFLNNLKSSHTSTCIFANNIINKSFETLPKNSFIMKQELIENISTFISNYLQLNSIQIPIISNTISQLIISKKEFNKNILNNEICLNIILLSICGWYLIHNKYLQCRYCNKCISFITNYNYKKYNQLFTEIYNEINDISECINIENEEESIIYKLSKLGLKIKNIQRSHNFHVYETHTLQKPLALPSQQRKPLRGTSFGSNVGFGAINNNNNGSMNQFWPKQSVLKQLNKKKKINKKRTRNQMSLDMCENENKFENYSDGFDNNTNNSQCPRKKMRIAMVNSNTNNMKNNNNNNVNVRGVKSRKRKTMDSDYDECDNNDINNNEIAIKKRRISSDLFVNNVGIISNNLELKQEEKEIEMNVNVNVNVNRNVKSRKRKFNDVFCDGKNECSNEWENEIECKRIKLNKLYFDIIGLHNDNCPYKIKNMYRLNECDMDQRIYGWEYCLKLIPNDIVFIQSIVKQLKKGNQAKSRI